MVTQVHGVPEHIQEFHKDTKPQAICVYKVLEGDKKKREKETKPKEHKINKNKEKKKP